MTRKTSNYLWAFIACLAAGTGLGTYSFLARPDRDGVWLLAVILICVAIVCALQLTFNDSEDSPSDIMATPLFLLSTLSFWLSTILSETFLNPSFPLASIPDGFPAPTGVAVVSFAAARDLVARVAVVGAVPA